MQYKKQTTAKPKINKQIKPNKNKHSDTGNRLVVTRGEGLGGRVKWVKGSTVCDGWKLNF